MKSYYLALIHSKVPNLIKCLWILKAQLKIKIFSWYLQRGVILTKDNLIERNGFTILALGKAKQTRAKKSMAMQKSTKRSPEVRFNFLLEVRPGTKVLISQ